MPMHRLTDTKVCTSLAPILAHVTADATGTGIPVGGYEEVLMVWQQGVCLDTLSGALYWSLTFEESDTLATGYTTIATADLEGGVGTHLIDAAAEDPTIISRRYKGSKAYVRMLGTKTGTHTNGTPLAALVICGKAIHTPVTQETELGTDT
jgi:hypothetical protein